jgi:multidrug efflux system membrane fusion protein
MLGDKSPYFRLPILCGYDIKSIMGRRDLHVLRGGPPITFRYYVFNRRAVLALLTLGFALLILYVRHVQHLQQAVSSENPTAPAKASDPPAAVAVAVAAAGDMRVKITAPGTITPFDSVTVKPQVSGIVQRIRFREGQTVRKGALLAQIDPRSFQAVVNQVRGNLLRDRAQLNAAKVDLKRYEALLATDSISAQTLDSQRALVKQYRGVIESDEGQLENARINLAYTRIRSPLNGRLGLRLIDQGNYVAAGTSSGIVVVNEVNPISVLFDIPADRINEVLRRMRAAAPPHGAAPENSTAPLHGAARLQIEAYDRLNQERIATGVLVSVDNTVDIASGTVKARGRLANADGRLFPNQFVNVALIEDSLPGQILIPTAAVHRGAQGGETRTFVYVVNADHTCSSRAVTLSAHDADRVAVSSGLEAGERVVTMGGDGLRDGATVELARP